MDAPDPVAALSAELAGRYVVEREVGSGDMASVSGKTKDVALGIAPAVDTADGFLLGARADGTGEARRFNTATGDTAGPPIRVGDPVALRSPVSLYAEFAASASGTVVTVIRSPFTSSGVAVTLRVGVQLGVASKTTSQTLMNAAAIGWDVDATGTRFVYGSDASNSGGPPRLVVTVNALGKR